ncbi:hypothetical protein DV495_004929 [Geotrichum candidum]|nr:hypothetical protein DV454_004318 [Geotrichum candidum]KAI9212933.1 hypothetical protein DS838_002195 [Geotrichum bryndzae]KAF5118227.1 hypothetical protein DV495_004929 [Geotrichum candidum]KAF5119900.1 hypothetical protein DV452_001417 [Geotrichum candidum]KAF7499391.1 hypothetical protein DV113_002583 [Geotrichum candidum]
MSIDEDREDEDWQKIMASGFNAGGIDSAVPTLGDDVIKHADNAIDYGEEDELADDEDLPEEEPPSGNNNIDDNDNELSALIAEGENNIYKVPSSFSTSNAAPSHQPFATNNYEESLEERVGSDYAAALMDFDDDWMGGGSGGYSLDNLKSGFNLPQGANSMGGLPGTGLDMDINMPDALRLKMVVFRVLNKSEHHRISVKDISAHFPGQNEMQNRQRLKEFMEFQRTGPDQGFWKMRGKEPLPNEDQIRAMISPEDIALLEAMQVGQQHLEDAGYSKTVDDEDEEGDSIEEQLAPWNITRNFINATQGKAMLQLHGEGDPSGCGEGFSFLRTSMKGGFKAMGESVNETLDKSKFGGHSYNVALQQKAYDDEISRIWYTQAKSLSNTNIEDLGWDETDAKRSGQESGSYDPKTPVSSHGAGDDDNESDISHSTNQNQNKILKITRLVRDNNGTLQRKIETITEPNIIRAYVKRRREIEDSLIGIDQIAPSNDEEQNKRHRKRLESTLAKLQRNKDRRLVRKALKAGVELPKSQLSTGDKKKSNKGVGKGKSTTRKCATCGAIGHIRTKYVSHYLVCS